MGSNPTRVSIKSHFMIVPQKVNRKQFFFLLYQFLLKNNIHREWYEDSLEYKLECVNPIYNTNYSRSDDFRTYLEKSINVYIDFMHRFRVFNGCIGGFFYHAPSSFDFRYKHLITNQWLEIAREWNSKYCHTKYVE